MSSAGNSGKVAAVLFGVLGSLAVAAVTAAVAVAEQHQQQQKPTTTKPAKKRQPRKKQSFLSITPRGEYWWQLSNAEEWLLLPSTLLSHEDSMAKWQSLAAHDNANVSFASAYENVVEALVQSNRIKQEDKLQILRDIPRTFPDEEYFSDRDVQDSMERVLICVCMEYPQVGYVQSMNFLCSYLFLHCKSEDACFALFRVLMQNPEMQMQEMYRPGLPMLFRALQAFEILLDKHCSRAMQHMRKVNMELMMFAQTWFMTLFTYSMDWQVCVPVWDSFFQRGWEAVLRVAVFLVKQYEDEICAADFDEIAELMREACGNATLDLADKADMLKFDSDDLEICKRVAHKDML